MHLSFLCIAGHNCTNETLRLVDGPVESAGRVEICINGVWGTVCAQRSYDWNNNNARVVCRQLGYNVDTSESELNCPKKIGDIANSQMLHNSDWDNSDAMVECRQLGYSVNLGSGVARSQMTPGHCTHLLGCSVNLRRGTLKDAARNLFGSTLLS